MVRRSLRRHALDSAVSLFRLMIGVVDASRKRKLEQCDSTGCGHLQGLNQLSLFQEIVC
jgi:hypothetical protein